MDMSSLARAGASGLLGGTFGWPIDTAVNLGNLARAAYGYGGHRLGLLGTDDLPAMVDPRGVPGTSEHIAGLLGVGDSGPEQVAQFVGGLLSPSNGKTSVTRAPKKVDTGKLAGIMAKYARRAGLEVSEESSKASASKYLEIYGPRISATDAPPIKIRIADHNLPSYYSKQADVEIGPHDMGSDDWITELGRVIERAGGRPDAIFARLLSRRNNSALSDDLLRELDEQAFRASEWARNNKPAGAFEKTQTGYRVFDGAGGNSVIPRADVPAAVKTNPDRSALESFLRDWIAHRATDRK